MARLVPTESVKRTLIQTGTLSRTACEGGAAARATVLGVVAGAVVAMVVVVVVVVDGTTVVVVAAVSLGRADGVLLGAVAGAVVGGAVGNTGGGGGGGAVSSVVCPAAEARPASGTSMSTVIAIPICVKWSSERERPGRLSVHIAVLRSRWS